MEAYLGVFVNKEQNHWASFLSMAKFAYINTKNANTSHMSFKLNYGYYLGIFLEDKVNHCLRFCSTNKLVKNLRESMTIC